MQSLHTTNARQCNNSNNAVLSGGAAASVLTGVGSGIKHIVQHSIMVHIKPVGDVSQPVWATGIRRVKKNRRQKNTKTVTPATSREYGADWSTASANLRTTHDDFLSPL